MFKFFKNKRYYRKNWTGDIIDSEILVRGDLIPVKVYPYEVRHRKGWLDVESVYMEYFVKPKGYDTGYHVQADGYTTALMKVTGYVEEEGQYVW